jgi:hypothetical protein
MTSALRRGVFFVSDGASRFFSDAKNINLHETTEYARDRKLTNTGRIPAGVRFAVLFAMVAVWRTRHDSNV